MKLSLEDFEILFFEALAGVLSFQNPFNENIKEKRNE